MILKIFADTVQRMSRFNPNPAEMVGIADAGQLQEMWRADGTGREDDFRIGVCKLGLAAAREFDAGCALTVEPSRWTIALVTTCRLGRRIAGCR